MGRRLVAGLTVDVFCICLGRAVDVRGARAGADCIVVTCIHMRHPLTHPLPFHPHATLSWVQKKPRFTHFSFILLVSSILEVTKTRLYESWLFFFLLLHILRRTLDLTVDLAFFFVVYTFLLECIFWFYYTRWLGCFVCCKNNIPFRCKYLLLVCVKCSLYCIGSILEDPPVATTPLLPSFRIAGHEEDS